MLHSFSCSFSTAPVKTVRHSNSKETTNKIKLRQFPPFRLMPCTNVNDIQWETYNSENNWPSRRRQRTPTMLFFHCARCSAAGVNRFFADSFVGQRIEIELNEQRAFTGWALAIQRQIHILDRRNNSTRQRWALCCIPLRVGCDAMIDSGAFAPTWLN